MKTRTETDTLGPIEVPADRYWGARTQRSLRCLSSGEQRMPLEVFRTFAVIKMAAAETNRVVGYASDSIDRSMPVRPATCILQAVV